MFAIAKDLRAYDLETGQLKWVRKSSRNPTYWLSPGGRYAAIHEGWWLSKSRIERILGSLSEAEAAVFDPDALQTRLRVLDLDANEFLTTQFPNEQPKCFSLDGAFLRLEGPSDGNVEDPFIDIATGERVSVDAAKQISASDSLDEEGVPIPGTSFVVKTHFHRLCRVVDTNDATFLREITPGPSYDVCARGHQAGRQFAIGDDSGAIRLVSTSTWCVERVIPGTCEVSDIAVSSDSMFLAAVYRPTYDGPFVALLWDLKTLTMLGAMKHESGSLVWTLRVDEQRAYLYDHRIRWLGRAGGEEHRFYERANLVEVNRLGRLDLKGRPLPSFRSTTFDMLSSPSGPPKLDYRKFRPEPDRALSHNGRWLAIARSDTTIVVDVAQEAVVHEMPSGLLEPETLFLRGVPGACSVSEDGSRVAVGHCMIKDIDVIVYDFRKRTSLNHKVCCDTYDSLAFHPANSFLAVGDEYQSMVQLVDLRRKRRNKNLEAHAGAIRSLEFCPDGSRLISASKDGQIILWDAETFERQATLIAIPDGEGDDQALLWIAYQPDGKFNGSPVVEEQFVVTLKSETQS